MANDPVQRFREAIIAVLDNRPELEAVTGRVGNQIVAWGNVGEQSDADLKAGMLAYEVIVAKRIAADSSPRRATVQFAAVAGEESIANELLGVVESVFDAPAFLSLVPPLDAWIEDSTRSPMPYDEDEELARADLDVEMRVNFA